jgi:hypothetical protein
MALGIITAMRNGLTVAVGAGGAVVTGGRVEITAVGWTGMGTGAAVGVAVAHAVASMLTNKTAITSFFMFIFFLLME